jgi:amino acid transporter
MMARIRRLLRAIKRVASVLWEYLGRRLQSFWAGVLVPTILGFVACRVSAFGASTTQALQTASSLLAIGGLCLVAYGYLELRRHFNRRGVRDGATYFVREFLSALRAALRTDARVMYAGTAGINFGGAASAALGFTSATIPTLEERVSRLEADYARLSAELKTLNAELTKKHAELMEHVTTEITQIRQQIAETKALLENVTIGGLGTEVTGWFWLLGSTVLAWLATL